MAKLPGVEDLGPAPNVQVYRPASVGGYDTSGYAAGGQALAKGAEALGTGLERAGADVAEVAARQSSFEYAQAHSEFLTGKVGLDGETAKATNPGPDESGKSLPNRYAEQLWQQRDAAAAKISDPRMRARFISEVAPTVEHGIVQAQSHATGLQNSADIAYVQKQGDTTINSAIGATDDLTRMQLLDAHSQLVDGLQAKGAITPERALAMKQEWAHQYATADLLARSETDPQGVINELRAKPGSNAAITNRILQNEGTDKNSRSSATGAGQFIDSTWLDMIKTNRPDLAQGRSDAEILALRADKGLGRDMTEAYRAQNEASLKSQGVDSGPGAQYLAHFLGPGGAAAVLKADPKAPIADVLAKAVGPDKAQAMIAANPTILQGQLAGSVKQWADGKMGGQVPGGGSIYDILRPDTREQILTHAQGQLQKQSTNDLTDFKTKLEDSQAEASRTGNLVNPIPQSEFIGHLGALDGPKAYDNYRANIQLGFDVASVSQMNPDEQQKLLAGYEPQPGAKGFAESEKRRDILIKAIDHANAEKKDAAGFAISRLPASGDAWKSFADAIGDPAVAQEDKQAAARKFAAVTLAEQERVGIPPEQRAILPKSYVDHFKKQLGAAADSDDPQMRLGLIDQVQKERQLWGSAWSGVMPQLTDGHPIVRAMADGAEPNALARLLRLPKDMTPAKIVGEADEGGPKIKEVTGAVGKALQPYLGTLLPFQQDKEGEQYRKLATNLSALYVRDGAGADDAAARAVKELIGPQFDVRGKIRIPKAAQVDPDMVAVGAEAARHALGELGAKAPANDLPGRSGASVADDMRQLGRNGTWITAPDHSGLMMVDGAGNFVRGGNKPLVVPWAELVRRGQTEIAGMGTEPAP